MIERNAIPIKARIEDEAIVGIVAMGQLSKCLGRPLGKGRLQTLALLSNLQYLWLICPAEVLLSLNLR